MEQLQRIPRRIRKSKLARNSGWMFLGYGLRILLQAAYFILLARALGVKEYGAFVAVLSMVAILSPFSGLGAGFLLVKKVARCPGAFSEAWGQALFLALSSNLFLAAILMGVGRFALPRQIGQETILLVIFGDLMGTRLADLCSMAFGALEQFHWNAFLQVSSTGFRAVAAGIMVELIRRPTVIQWVRFYAVSSVLMTICALALVTRKLGRPTFKFRGLWRDMKEGSYYAMSASAQTIYNDTDKTMLARLSTLSATGIYAAAYRVIDLSCAPLRSITSATYPSFFREGDAGLGTSFRLARRMTARTSAISLVLTIAMLLLAPLLFRILGPGFQSSVAALRWLALLPVLRSIHVMFGNALTGAGHQRIRAILQIAVAVFNVGINFWLIGTYSWRGAAWSSLACDSALVALTIGAILVLWRRETSRAASAPPQLAATRSR